MKKLINNSLPMILIRSILFFVLTIFIQPGLIEAQQVTVNLELPPPFKFMVEDLWKLSITNQANTMDIYLYGTVERDSDGSLLVEATSSVFNLPKGTKRITAEEIKPINVKQHNNEIETVLNRTGTFPSGEYKICVYVKNPGDQQTIAVDCKQQTVESVSQINLVNPNDGTVAPNKQITFTWFPIVSELAVQPSYILKIVEVHGNQSFQEAMSNNPAFYESDNLTGTSFVYPSSANDFQAGNKYCWMVTSYINSTSVSQSDIWSFTYQSSIVTPTFDCSFVSYTPLELKAEIKSKNGTQRLIELIPEWLSLMKVYFSCVEGALYASGLDDNLHPYKIKGAVLDTTARSEFGERAIHFSLDGKFNLPEEFSSAKIDFIGNINREGMTGSFEAIAVSSTVTPDTVKFVGNFSAQFITALTFNYFIYPYISIFKVGSISYEYSKKLDDYFDTCLEGVIDKKKKEEVLKKCVISINKFMCRGAVALTTPPKLTFPDIDIYLSGSVCTISATSLLDEYIHAAGFVAKLGTSEDTDHLFKDYVIECLNLCVLVKGGAGAALIKAAESRIDALLSNKDLSDNLDKFKKATGISISHK